MTGFKPRTSGVGKNRSTNWTTITASRFNLYGSKNYLQPVSKLSNCKKNDKGGRHSSMVLSVAPGSNLMRTIYAYSISIIEIVTRTGQN